MISYLITADPGVALDPADVKSRPAKQRRICSAGLIYCDQHAWFAGRLKRVEHVLRQTSRTCVVLEVSNDGARPQVEAAAHHRLDIGRSNREAVRLPVALKRRCGRTPPDQKPVGPTSRSAPRQHLARLPRSGHLTQQQAWLVSPSHARILARRDGRSLGAPGLFPTCGRPAAPSQHHSIDSCFN